MKQEDSIIIGEGTVRFALEYRDLKSDQGVCVQVIADIGDEEVELLRFDCFDHQPHYHYGPRKRNERLTLV